MRPYLRKVFWRQLLIHLPIILCLLAGWWHGALICLAITAVVMAYVALCPTTGLAGPVVTHLDQPGVLLTLDDGPDPATTPAVLDLLDEHQIKAVFFLIGDRVNRWPELAKEIARRGHIVGNHSQTHPSASFWSLGPWRIWREIKQCQETLKRCTGVSPTWFRAPVGHYNTFVHPALSELNLRLMAWDCRGFDGTDKQVERVLGRISQGLKPGSVVLLHEAQPHCIEVLKGVLQLLEERKLSVVSLEESGLTCP